MKLGKSERPFSLHSIMDVKLQYFGVLGTEDARSSWFSTFEPMAKCETGAGSTVFFFSQNVNFFWILRLRVELWKQVLFLF